MVGQTISHYKILEKLGEGGMGVVYKAEDTRLKRMVALKFLPAAAGLDPDAKARFKREAETASALDHPNICTIYDVHERIDGQSFISMAYYQGETLKEKVDRGPLPIDDTIDIALQIARGLQAAHEAGITHRDIKPANIVLTTRGEAKILDFGLARVHDRTMLTRDGTTLGTVSYMSPEQVKGDPVDHRTDIWSLGVVIYEMITGRLPFRGDYDQAIIYQTLNAEPDPLEMLRADTRPGLRQIVAKAMQKDQNDRYQRMQTLCADLQSLKSRSREAGPPSFPTGQRPQKGSLWVRIAGSTAVIIVLAAVGIFLLTRRPAAIDSLALLPFVNATNDSTLDYLCDGLTETLINRFSQLPHLHVTARTTAFNYKGKDQDPQKVGRALNVRAVLTGKLVQRNNLLTIQVDLVDAVEGTQLWGERYNSTLSDVLVLQDEIAGQIADRLRLKLSSEEQRRLNKSFTQNTEAYQLYLKGRYWAEKLTLEGFHKAVGFYDQAIEKDPSYALAYAGLADAYYWVGNMYLPPKQAMEKSRAAARRAVERDGQLSEAHLSLALVKMGYDFDWPGAEEEFRSAIELNPGYAGAHFWYGRYLTFLGRYDESTAELRRAQQLDPLSPFINIEMGLPAFFMRRYDESIENARKVVEMYPSFYFGHYVMGDQYLQRGDYSSAIAEFQTALQMEDSPVVLAGLGRAYAAAGETSRAESIIQELSTRLYPPSYDIALIYCSLGKNDRAVDLLLRAYEEKNDQLIWLKGDPRMDNLRPDPRFVSLIRRLGLEK